MNGKATEKLTPYLHNKQKYLVHYHNLKQHLQLGLMLKQVHRAIQFQQSIWLKQCIDLNNEKREQAKNPFEEDCYRLMNNSMFGKTMENVAKSATEATNYVYDQYDPMP